MTGLLALSKIFSEKQVHKLFPDFLRYYWVFTIYSSNLMSSAKPTTELLAANVEDEPEHGCCTRVLCFPASAAVCIPAGLFLAFEAVSAPIQFLALVICKATICNCCCPDNIHHTFRNIICSPCRWMRISCTGKGHIVCWKHPAWPFRP